jgi:hypothetical protein
MESPVRCAISLSECAAPVENVSRIATTLLVTERPGPVEFPANSLPFTSLSGPEDHPQAGEAEGKRCH